MRIARPEKAVTGHLDAVSIDDHSRLSFPTFAKIYPGRLATPSERAMVRGMPDGFSVWITNRGALMGVRDE